jgi:DNA-binding MarR family transcriptional regulator
VREEDLDWLLYHRIPEKDGISIEDLIEAIGCDPATVTASLERLERYCLIQRSGEMVRLLSFQESLVKCHCKHMEDLPFFYEDGVIKAKKKDG